MKLLLANTSTAAKLRVYFYCVDATDGLTPETGEAGGQPQISTDGGAFTNTGIGTLTHQGNGRYYAELTQAAVATAGLVITTRFKSANTAETPGTSVQVVAFDPDSAASLGLTNLDAAVSSRSTLAGTAQTGDAYARLGAPAGASVSADVAAVKAETASLQTDTNDIQTRLPAALVSGRIDASVGAMAADTLTAAALATDAGAELADAIWDEATAGHVAAGSTGLALTSGSAPSAATIADAVWDEALAGHAVGGSAGAALSAAGATAGSGSELLTVTVLDDSAVAVVGATVYAHNAAGALVGTATTGAGGTAVVNPGAGVITLTARYIGLLFAAEDVTVSVGVNQTATLDGTVAVVPVGSSPGRCALYAYLELPTGLPAVGVTGTARVTSLPEVLSGEYVSNATVSAVSDAAGLISWDLPRGASVTVEVPAHVPTVQVTVPSAASAALDTL